MLTIAKRITKARQSLGLTQKELAIKSQITESSLSRFKRGTRESRTDAVSKLSKALDVSPNYLIFGLKNDSNFNNKSLIEESIEDIISDFSIKIKKLYRNK